MNLRYLSASGILKRSGRGITVMPEYKSLAYELTKNVISDATLKERYKLLCQGAPLPTDNTEIAKKVLEDLINELEMYNIKYEIPDITLDNSKNINSKKNRGRLLLPKKRTTKGKNVLRFI